MDKYDIKRRSISEAIYLKNNPGGDPFRFSPPRSISAALLYGLGLGLYWGEGNKANLCSVRLGNTDPGLILVFMRFLIFFFNIEKRDLRFSLQIFTDIDKIKALKYWCRKLGVTRSQFRGITITRSLSIGTYRKKSEYGVVTVYYHNKKLRDVLCQKLEEVRPT